MLTCLLEEIIPVLSGYGQDIKLTSVSKHFNFSGPGLGAVQS